MPFTTLLLALLFRTVIAQNEWISNGATSNASKGLSLVAYGNGTLVAVNGGFPEKSLLTSTDEGTTWVSRTTPINWCGSAITFGEGVFVVVCWDVAGAATTPVFTSNDGILWEERTAAANNKWSSVVYGDGVFVAVSNADDPAQGDQLAMTSEDRGATWQIQTTGEALIGMDLASITYGAGKFLAVALSSPTTGSISCVAYSEDKGKTWVLASDFPSDLSTSWNGVAFGKGVFVAVSASINSDEKPRVMTSDDSGTTWVAQGLNADQLSILWSDIVFYNGYFVALGGVLGNIFDSLIMTSENASDWTSQTTPTFSASQMFWSAICGGYNRFFAVGTLYFDDDSTSAMGMYSPTTTTPSPTPTTSSPTTTTPSPTTTTPSPTPTTSSPTRPSEMLSTDAIVGIVLGLLSVVAIAFLLYTRLRSYHVKKVVERVSDFGGGVIEMAT